MGDPPVGRPVGADAGHEGDAEVGDVRLAVVGDEDVLGAQVAVDEVAAVGALEGTGDLDADGEHAGSVHARADPLGHRAAAELLHHHVGLVGVGVAVLQGVDDVGVFRQLGEPGLVVVEPGPNLGRLGVPLQDLEDHAVARGIGCSVGDGGWGCVPARPVAETPGITGGLPAVPPSIPCAVLSLVRNRVGDSTRPSSGCVLVWATPGGSTGLLDLDLDVDDGGEVEALQGVHVFGRRLDDVEQVLVDAHLEVLAGVLVLVGRADDRVAALVGPGADRAPDHGTGAMTVSTIFFVDRSISSWS